MTSEAFSVWGRCVILGVPLLIHAPRGDMFCSEIRTFWTILNECDMVRTELENIGRPIRLIDRYKFAVNTGGKLGL